MIFNGEPPMNTAMIPVASDVLARLLTLRRSERESLDDVLRRVLPAAKPPVTSAERAIATPSTSGSTVSYKLDGQMRGDNQDGLNVNLDG
jgi:predicted CopG family antitoxin